MLDNTSATTLTPTNPNDLYQDFGYQTCTVAITLNPISNTEVCSGESIHLEVLASAGQAGVTYTWVATDGATMVGNGVSTTNVSGIATIQEQQFNTTSTPLNITYTLMYCTKKNKNLAAGHRFPLRLNSRI